MRDASLPQLTLQCDSQGRLTDRLVSGGDTYRYDYDGAGRLDNAEVNGKPSYYGYNVDDELIFDNHKGYRVYRFGSYRYSSNDKRTIVKPVPQVALLTQSGKTTSRWVFLEPDGHAFESAGDIEGQAQELSFDILGAYGRTLASSGDVLLIDGFHGADADPGRGVVPFGVRHVVKDVGMWMQPEPLLYLGVAVGGRVRSQASMLPRTRSSGATRRGLIRLNMTKRTEWARRSAADRYISMLKQSMAADCKGESTPWPPMMAPWTTD